MHFVMTMYVCFRKSFEWVCDADEEERQGDGDRLQRHVQFRLFQLRETLQQRIG